MSLRGETPRMRGSSSGRSTIQEKVAQFYYSHGLFCSTYPAIVVSIAISIALICCCPLVNLPLPGNAPLQTWISSWNTSSFVGQQPFCYVQQVVLRTAVLPWEDDLTLGDAFRAPLYEAFKLLDVVRNYQHTQSTKGLGHLCLHVEAIKRNTAVYYSVLPQYSCLVLSPANLWQQDVQKFAQDNSLLTTIFNHHSFQKGKTSISEMLFGMHLYDTGIKRYPLRNRQRIIQFAVTLFLSEYDEEFVNGLRQKLQTVYPLHQDLNATIERGVINDTLLIQYPGEINYIEFVPLTFAFVLLFLYYYFSVRKIELIKSKLGMAFTAVITILGSLTMTLGLCFFFGLTLNLEGKEVFPFLVLLVGLENVLVLTKSVVSTPTHLDIKIRIAQSLSKEGWSITKNLLLEITILTFGLFTFVPKIQEFCIFAIVGLLTDYFMQMMFFSTILGIDIRRMENLVEKANPNFRSTLFQTNIFYDKSFINCSKGMNRSKSHPRLSSFPANVVAGQIQGGQEKKIPKRLRLVNIWARTRFFQRSFMILMVTWICSIAYNSGIIEHYILNSNSNSNNVVPDTLNEQNKTEQNYSSIKLFPLLDTNSSFIKVNYVTHSPFDVQYEKNQTDEIEKLQHLEYAPWLKLAPQHWLSILKKYNLSVSGQYIAVLPSIKISHVIRPDQAVLLRNPDEKYGEKFQWQALAAALDPIDFSNMETTSGKTPQSEQPFYPTSVFAIVLTTILCLISVIVLGYTFVVLYRCICSRNYAEWRASWFSEKNEESGEEPVLLEAVPVVLEGHKQQIECVAADGATLVSSCLDGQLKVWDSSTGELIANIDRRSHFSSANSNNFNDDCDDNSSDYESGSPPSRSYLQFPKLKHRINTNFSNVADGDDLGMQYDARMCFNHSYRELYFNSDVLKIRNRHNKYPKRAKDEMNSSDVVRVSFTSDLQIDKESNNSTIIISDKIDNKLSPIWCIDYLDNLIVIGCADGRLEFWDGITGKLKCIFEDGTDVGINNVKIVGSRVVASRLYGTLDLFQLQTYNHGRPIDWNFTCAYRRTHVRTGSVGSITEHNLINQNENDDDLRCLKVLTLKSHQQPITCLDCEGGRILTGSQDHTLKVFRLEDGSPLYTLHGHCGPITCLFIDRINPATSGSGSQDGMLCVWDLLTGACMYNIQAHDGSVNTLTYSASYVISLGSDDRLCVWERFQGHLLNTIYVSQTLPSQVLMLAPHLVVTGRSGGLAIWDVRSGDCVRTIALGRSPFVFIKQLILLRDAVLCDYGNQLRIVRFPLITHKFD